MYEDFINKVINHPQWEVIRSELCAPTYEEDIVKTNLGGGLQVWEGYDRRTDEEVKKDNIFMKLCWYVNNGPGYCEDAPEYIKVYLRRLKVKV